MNPEEVWIVCEGVVQLGTLLASGTEIILGLMGAYTCFGLSLTQTRPLEAMALSDTKLLRLHCTELDESPRWLQYRFKMLKQRSQQTETLLIISHHPLVKDRLRHLILFLQEEFGQVTPHGIQITVKLTHQQLANMIGTTRVTVTRLMKEMRAEGLEIRHES